METLHTTNNTQQSHTQPDPTLEFRGTTYTNNHGTTTPDIFTDHANICSEAGIEPLARVSAGYTPADAPRTSPIARRFRLIVHWTIK